MQMESKGLYNMKNISSYAELISHLRFCYN
jgi:hypothetical protein